MIEHLKDRAQRGVAIEQIGKLADNARRSMDELAGDIRSPEGFQAYGGAVYLIEEIGRMAAFLEEVEKRGTDERLRETLEGIRDAAERRGDRDLSGELDRVMWGE
jgi:hypothetical protein